MSNILNNTASLQGILEALQGKAAGGGGRTVIEKDVNFYDYDGTLLYSYTLAEIQRLTELPALPTREGLICQEWNWTLDELKALGRPMTVGATYITDDGATRAHIDIYDETLLKTMLNFNQSVANGVAIDWGDGSPTETYGTSGNATLYHTYKTTGKYTISLLPSDSCSLTLSYSGYSAYTFMSNDTNAEISNRSVLKEVNTGIRCSLGHKALQSCRNLVKVSISKNTSWGESSLGSCCALNAVVVPRGMYGLNAYTLFDCFALSVVSIPATSIVLADYALRKCYSLKRIDIPSKASISGEAQFYVNTGLQEIFIPDEITSVKAKMFFECQSLQKVTMNKVASIGSYGFGTCQNLPKIVIPSTCTSIQSSAFDSCSSLKAVYFKSATPPTLSADASTSVFKGVPTTCVYYVPKGALATYQGATNYASIASQIQEEE